MISIVIIIRSARHQVYCALPHQAARSTGWPLSINPAELISEGSSVTLPFSMASTHPHQLPGGLPRATRPPVGAQ